VGTHNLDYRSWLYNLEINVSMVDATLSRELTDRIEQAIVVSQRIDLKTWALRPLLHRWLEKLLYRFRRLL
jgi:cardiolipin synthase